MKKIEKKLFSFIFYQIYGKKSPSEVAPLRGSRSQSGLNYIEVREHVSEECVAQPTPCRVGRTIVNQLYGLFFSCCKTKNPLDALKKKKFWFLLATVAPNPHRTPAPKNKTRELAKLTNSKYSVSVK